MRVDKFRRKDFYIRIQGYGKNIRWGNAIKKTAEKAVTDIMEQQPIDTVLINITEGVKKANRCCFDSVKAENTGVLRTARSGWKQKRTNKVFPWDTMRTGYDYTTRYGSYEERLDRLLIIPIESPIPDIELTRPVIMGNSKYLKHPDKSTVNRSLGHIGNLYGKLQKIRKKKNLTEQDLAKINDIIAEIRWVLAHSTPWNRGSDAIANVFMKALYKALGIQTSPPAKGISFDLEAFCTPLSEYKKAFPTFFETPPTIVQPKEGLLSRINVKGHMV